MNTPLTTEQGVDFDKDLARLDQIRRAHKSARPTSENPAWMNTHGDLGFALGFIDDLWRTYTNEMRKLDQLQNGVRELQARCCGSDDLCNGCRALLALLPAKVTS